MRRKRRKNDDNDICGDDDEDSDDDDDDEEDNDGDDDEIPGSRLRRSHRSKLHLYTSVPGDTQGISPRRLTKRSESGGKIALSPA